jgi:hypothetical protein
MSRVLEQAEQISSNACSGRRFPKEGNTVAMATPAALC